MKVSGFLTAILPPVIICAPDEKAILKSSSDFKPPPKSITKLVLVAIDSSTL